MAGRVAGLMRRNGCELRAAAAADAGTADNDDDDANALITHTPAAIVVRLLHIETSAQHFPYLYQIILHLITTP